MDNLGKLLVTTGGALVLIGLGLWLSPRLPLLGRLPGDISLGQGRFSLHAPLASMLLISLALTLFVNLALWVMRR